MIKKIIVIVLSLTQIYFSHKYGAPAWAFIMPIVLMPWATMGLFYEKIKRAEGAERRDFK